MLKKYLLDAGKNPIFDAEKSPVLKKHLLDAGKVPNAGKTRFDGWKNTTPHCEVYWDLDFGPFENEWQAS